MPQNNNKRVNRYATRSNMNRLRTAAGMPNSTRTTSRFGFARLNPAAAPWSPASASGAAPAPAPAPSSGTGSSRRARRASRRSSRRNMTGGRRHRRSTTRKGHKHRRANRR